MDLHYDYDIPWFSLEGGKAGRDQEALVIPTVLSGEDGTMDGGMVTAMVVGPVAVD